MPLLDFLATSNTFRQWLATTNNLISTISNTSVFVLVSQNATPDTTTGNVSINGTMTIATVTANGTVTANVFSGNGVSLTTLNASALATGTVPLGRLSSANSSANGVVDTTTQSFAGNKTFDNNVAITGYLTVGNNTITLNSTTLIVGNSAANLVFTASGITKDGVTVINESGSANNAAYAFGKTEGALNVNSASHATNATNLNSQPGSYYTNASNLATGTVPVARLSLSASDLTNGVTGSGAVALATSPTLVTPNLGTPSAVTLTNATGLPESAITDGSILARLAANETVTGSWTFSSDEVVGSIGFKSQRAYSDTAGSGPYFNLFNADASRRWNIQPGASNDLRFNYYNGSSYSNLASLSSAGLLTVSGTGSHAYSGTAGTTTLANFLTISNAGGSGSMLGVESSAGGSILSGSAAYTTVLRGYNSAGISIAATDASGDIRFYNRGTTLALTLGASQAASFTGVVSSTGFGTHSFSAGGAGANAIRVNNTTSGTGNYSSLELLAGTTETYLNNYSQGFTTSGLDIAASFLVKAQGSGGLSLAATTQDVRIYSRNTLAATFGASQAATFTGLISATAFGTHSFSAGGTGGNVVSVRNTTSGTGNLAGVYVGNDASVSNLYLQSFSSAFTTSGVSFADGALVAAERAGGLSLAAINASGDVRIYSRNALALTIGASQVASFTGNVRLIASTSDYIEVSNSSNTEKAVYVSSNANGTAATAAFRVQNVAYTGWLTLPTATFTTAGLREANVLALVGDAPTLRLGTSHGSGVVQFYSGNALALTLGASQAASFTGDLSLAATKKLYLDGGGDTYITESSANKVTVYAGGYGNFLFMGVSGGPVFNLSNVGFGVGSGDKIYFDATAASGGGDTYIYEGASNNIYIVTGGTHRGGWNANGVYVNTYPTTASAANLWSQNGSNIHISTSSIRYKHDIDTLDADHALSAVMAMRPVTYRGKTDEDQRRYVGFIAEEMQTIAPLLATYDEGGESGTPNYVTYDRVTAYLVAVVQQQQAEIDALKAQMKEKQ